MITMPQISDNQTSSSPSPGKIRQTHRPTLAHLFVIFLLLFTFLMTGIVSADAFADQPLPDKNNQIISSADTFAEMTKTKASCALLQKRTRIFIGTAIGFIALLTILLIILMRLWKKAKQNEETLQKSKKELELTLDATTDGIWTWNFQTNQLFFSPRYYKMLGYEPNEFEASFDRWLNLIHPDDREGALSVASEYLKTKADRYENKFRMRTKNGAILWTRSVGKVVERDENGAALYMIGNHEDITERKLAKEALIAERDRFDLAMRFVNDGIFDWNLKTNEIYYSPMWKQLLGYENHEIKNEFAEWERLTDPEDVQASWKAIKEVIEGKSNRFDVEFKMLHKNGHWVDILARANVIFDEQGQGARVVGTHVDITRRKEAEKALQESDARFQALHNASFGGIAIHDKGAIVDCNRGMSEMTGYTFEELTNMDGLLLVAPQSRKIVMDNILAGYEKPYEVMGIRKNGEEYHLRIEARNVPYKGKMLRTTEFRDITGTKQAETALKASEASFRVMFQNNPAMMALTSMSDRRFVDVNESFLKTLGYSREEIIGKSSSEIGLSAEPEKLDTSAERLKANGHITNAEMKVRAKDGSIRHGLFFGDVINIQDKEYFLTVMIDNTDRKKAEADREKLQDQLIHAQKMESIGRLAGGVAHDFNNMLSIILGHTEMVMDQLTPLDLLYSDMEEIRKAAQRSADLTRQLLAFARKQTVAPSVLDLNQTVDGMLKMLRRLIGEDIDLTWKPGQNLWSVKIDPSQIDQILANMSVNARDAIAGIGNITIETENVAFDQEYCANHQGFIPGDYVLLAFSDDGCGMNQETLAHVFEPFFTTKKVGEGTGLGLATIYGAVKQNNGFINVYSEPGMGTRFTIYLPRHKPKTDALPDQTKNQDASRGQETILLTEDEPAILAMTASMLERQGYTVLTANTPGNAIRLAEKHQGRIDLLMTDVVMPEMNGRDLALNIQCIYPEIKRLFMSGYTADAIAQHGVLDEGVHFIQKPFSKKTLSAKVREALDL